MGRRRLFRRWLTLGAQLRLGPFGSGGNVVERDDEPSIGLDVILELGRLDSFFDDGLVRRLRSGRVWLRRKVGGAGRRRCRTGARTRTGPEGFQQSRSWRRRLGCLVRNPVRPVAGSDVQVAQPTRKLMVRLVVQLGRRRLDERHVLRFHVVDGRRWHGSVEHASGADRRSGSGSGRGRSVAGRIAAHRSPRSGGRPGDDHRSVPLDFVLL